LDPEITKRSPKTILVEGFLQDPYPTYRRFQAEGPIHFTALGSGFQTVFSYSLVSSLLRDPRFSAKRSGAMLATIPEQHRSNYAPLMGMLAQWLLFMDPPEHSRLRKLMNKGFTPVVAEMLRPQIEGFLDRMFDDLDGRTEIEFMSQLAHPFPARVIAELLGIPPSMNDDLLRWSEAIAMMLGNPHRTPEQCTAAQDAILALTNFFRAAVATRRRNPGSDLISLLLEIEADGEWLTEDELLAQCVMLLFGGHETTRNLIGNGIYTLLQHPDALASLRDDPSSIRSCVEELLRFQSPVQFIARVAKEDLTIEDTEIHAGEVVMLMLGAANRDPARFDDADVFDLSRENNSHLAFGAGPHFCIGNQIARLEAQMFILKFAQRFQHFQLADDQPQWSPNLALRGFKSLPIRLA
jgi:cytochrome P450